MTVRWVFFFLLLAPTVYAQQFPSDLWHEGKIILEEGDTLKGNVKYNLQSDLVQFEKSGRLESFTARKILFFEIFDKTVKRYRQFFSLPYTTSGQYKAPVFFELLSEGKITLLCRESIEYKSYPSTFYYYGSNTRLVLINKYFILNDKGSIEAFMGKKSDLIYLMGNQGDPVEKYMKRNKLGVENKYEFAQIVDYYNSLLK